MAVSAIKTLDERSQHILRARWLDDDKTTLQELKAILFSEILQEI